VEKNLFIEGVFRKSKLAKILIISIIFFADKKFLKGKFSVCHPYENNYLKMMFKIEI
jgi:hypothetical protein